MAATLVSMEPGVRPPAPPDFDEVFRRARPALVGLVSRVVDPAEAEDVVQEAFIKLSDNSVLSRPEPEITAWLRRTSLNLAFNRARDLDRWRRRTERAQAEDLARPGEDPAIEAVRGDEQRRVRALLAALPPRQRDCLLLRHTGYSYAEIAETLEMPASSVGTTLARAERAFRELHETHQGDDQS